MLISRSYRSKILVFINAFANIFSALNEVHQFLSQWCSAHV